MKRTQLPIYPKHREKISWKIPSLFNHDSVIFILSDICRELNIKLPIHSVYGCVRNSWGGGRPSTMQDIDEIQAKEIISKYNNLNISCCFTFSNYHITKDDLGDKIGNLLLEVASQSEVDNYAIISSDLLAEYIRNNYPNIKIISSILKPVYETCDYQDTPEYYNTLCERHDKVVVRPEICFSDKSLKKLKYKNKIEIIVNQDCLIYCHLARKHYDFHSQVELGMKQRSEDFCHSSKNKAETLFNTELLSNQDIDRIIKLGFTSFKLRGRTFTREQLTDVIGIYVFEPTGVFQNIKVLLLKRIREEEMASELCKR